MDWLYFVMLAIIVLMFGDKDRHYSPVSIAVAIFDIAIAFIYLITER